MKILITGATGFIGFNILKALLKRKLQVRALVRKASDIKKIKQKSITLFFGDLLAAETLVNATRNIDVIVHAAGVEGKFATTLSQLRQTHVEGTKNLLQAAKKNKVNRFILISSIAAIGLNQTADENTIPEPKTSYEMAKHESEEAVKEFCQKEKLKYTIIRCPVAPYYGVIINSLFGSFLKRRFLFSSLKL